MVGEPVSLARSRKGYPQKSITFVSLWWAAARLCFGSAFLKPASLSGFDGESAGARTQDQRLKRAMLYQLSYALRPHYQVSTFRPVNFPAKQWLRKLLRVRAFVEEDVGENRLCILRRCIQKRYPFAESGQPVDSARESFGSPPKAP
jgi:hypothetical protein